MTTLKKTFDSSESKTAFSLAFLSFAMLFELPMQLIWGSVNSIQLISHLPLSEVNFPPNTSNLFGFLAQIVSFNLYPMTKQYSFDISDTQPQSLGFQLLNELSVNFFDVIGTIPLILLFIVARIMI